MYPTIISLSRVSTPPIPDAIITPTLSESKGPFKSALSSIASSAAQRAYILNRSSFFIGTPASFCESLFRGSKFLIWAAILTGRLEVSNLSIYPTPLLPFTKFSQVSLTVWPRGVIAPRPVITTLLTALSLKVCNLSRPSPSLSSQYPDPGSECQMLPPSSLRAP